MGAYDIVTLVTLVAIAVCGTVVVVALYDILRESVSHRRAMRENTGDGILPHSTKHSDDSTSCCTKRSTTSSCFTSRLGADTSYCFVDTTGRAADRMFRC